MKKVSKESKEASKEAATEDGSNQQEKQVKSEEPASRVDISLLYPLWNPFDSWVGLESPITIEEVQTAIKNQDTIGEHNKNPHKPQPREYHIRRIAWFTQHTDWEPIVLECGWPEYDVEPYLQDGNHRLAAAIVLGHKWIYAHCSGVVSEIESFLYKP